MAATSAAPGQSVLVLVHHHLVSSAPDNLIELFSDLKRLPFMESLRHGEWLAERLAGRCAAVLHGHKHKESVQHVAGMPIVNAGSTTQLSRYRVLTLHDNRVVDAVWTNF